MTPNFVELSSYVGGRQGYADRPTFDGQLWPLFIKNASSIERVLLFLHRFSNVAGKTLVTDEHEKVSSNLISLGSFNQMSDGQLRMIAKLSFFGGHLSVLYEVTSQDPFLKQLVELFPNPPKPNNTTADSLGLEEDGRLEFAKFIASLPDSLVIVAFAHDADPVYIFGNPETLKQISPETE